MPKPLQHLSIDQHKELGRLLNEASDNIEKATKIVARREFTERSLHVRGTLQEWLVDPLNDAYEASSPRRTYDEYAGPYQATGYISRYKRRPPPKFAA